MSEVSRVQEPEPDDDTRETELWQVLDWSLWGNGLGDVLRFPMADAMVAALTDDQREQAEACIKAWHARRGPSMSVGEGTELQRQRDLLAWLHAEARWERDQALLEIDRANNAWREIVDQWERGHDNDVLPYTAQLEGETAALKAEVAERTAAYASLHEVVRAFLAGERNAKYLRRMHAEIEADLTGGDRRGC